MEFCIISCYSLKFNLAEIEIRPLRSKHSKMNREGFCIPCWDGCLVEVLNDPETTAGQLTANGDLRSVESAANSPHSNYPLQASGASHVKAGRVIVKGLHEICM